MSTPTWFQSWFESPWYMRLYRHRTEEEAREAVNLVARQAHVERGTRILDLCCGYGRHALALGEAGYIVTGIDGSEYLINRAQELYPHPNVTYRLGDMRGPFPGAPYQAIANFFTSFGYFDTHEENLSVLRNVRTSLVEGGMFVMDFFNAHRVRATLEPETLSMVDGVTILQERWIDEPFVRKRITVNDPCSQEQTFEERVWLYDNEALCDMAVTAGLRVTATLGTYSGEPFDAASSPRCIMIATAI